MVDADPQCNLTSFFLEEAYLDDLLGNSDDNTSGGTIWSAIKPVVDGKGSIRDINLVDLETTCSSVLETCCLPTMKKNYQRHGPARSQESSVIMMSRLLYLGPLDS